MTEFKKKKLFFSKNQQNLTAHFYLESNLLGKLLLSKSNLQMNEINLSSPHSTPIQRKKEKIVMFLYRWMNIDM